MYSITTERTTQHTSNKFLSRHSYILRQADSIYHSKFVKSINSIGRHLELVSLLHLNIPPPFLYVIVVTLLMSLMSCINIYFLYPFFVYKMCQKICIECKWSGPSRSTHSNKAFHNKIIRFNTREMCETLEVKGVTTQRCRICRQNKKFPCTAKCFRRISHTMKFKEKQIIPI